MSDLTLFDLEPDVEWAPVFHPPLDFDPLKDGERWKAYRALLRCRDCGRPVKGMPWKRGCGGARDEGAFDLCDDCAALDGAVVSSHTTVVERRPAHPGSFPNKEEAAHCLDCGWWLFLDYWGDEGGWVVYTPEEIVEACTQHEVPRWRSRWGVVHELGEHDGLVSARAKRRAAYLREVAA